MAKDTAHIDAIEYVMNNVFDWDQHARHAGLRMNQQDYKQLTQSLQKNLQATCPDVGDAEIFDLYGDLVHNNWLGEIDAIKTMTERVITAYMEAEQGDTEYLTALKREMKGKIRFMESHYDAVGHNADMPVHVAAEAMERNEKIEPRHNAESLSATLNQARTIVEDGGLGREKNLAKRKFPGLMRLIGR